MLDAQTIRRIAQLQLVTKQLMCGQLAGNNNTMQRGYGIEFDQIREYVAGDDVRFIDWKSSARFNKKLVKECLEERDRTIMVALDVSASVDYGSIEEKISFMRDVVASIVYAAHYAHDRIGLLLFSDAVHIVLPPKNTFAHVQQVVHTIYEQAIGSGALTDIAGMLNYCSQHWHKDASVFVVSDFIDEDYTSALALAAHRLDVVAIRCSDPIERSLPEFTCLNVLDVETGQTVCVEHVASVLNERFAMQDQQFAAAGVDVVDIVHGVDYCARLVALFAQRMRRLKGARA